jgi:hypothetical protein
LPRLTNGSRMAKWPFHAILISDFRYTIYAQRHRGEKARKSHIVHCHFYQSGSLFSVLGRGTRCRAYARRPKSAAQQRRPANSFISKRLNERFPLKS